MGRVPKKHRRAVEYTEAVDADDMNKTVENAEDANVGVGGDKEIEKSISENGSGKLDPDDEDFKSIHSDTDNNDESKQDEVVVEESDDDEPLKKTARAAKISNKEKRDSNGDNATKKKARKIAKKPPKFDEEYEVQDIVGHKVERGIDFYLVRWKGYTKADDTWEPSTTLSCPELIQKFKKKQSLTKDKLKNKASVGEKKGVKAKSNTKQQQYDPDKQWEVEKIIDYAQEKSGRIFRIRWKGYGAKHDTWEPERNLSCDEVIAKFMQRIKSQEFVSFKELRVDPKKPKRLVNETSLRTSYNNAIGRKSKRASSKKRVFYGDSD